MMRSGWESGQVKCPVEVVGRDMVVQALKGMRTERLL